MGDSAELRKYRIELPNLIDDLNLSVYAFRLYVHIKRVAGGNGGSCHQGTRTLAKHCCMSVGQIVKAKQELLDRQVITKTTRKTNGGDVDDLTPVDLWQQNYDRYGVHTVNTIAENEYTGTEGDRRPKAEEGGQKGVHDTNTGVHTVNEGVHTVNERKNLEERTIGEARAERTTLPPKKDPIPEQVLNTLADVCKIDLSVCIKVQRDQLFQSAGILYRAGKRSHQAPEQIADAIRYVAGYFRKQDWRGKKGETPTPAMIRQIWREAIEHRKSSTSNGKYQPSKQQSGELLPREQLAELARNSRKHHDTS